jgi:hypothetical protein
LASTAEAQQTRWDAAAHVTWLGERRPADQSFEWDHWFGVASGGGSVGFYWTPHLKTEFDLATSSEGDDYSYQTITVPGQTTPLFVQRDREVRFTTASAGVSGQFFENVWFHPFVSAGLELLREREHIETVLPSIPPRGVAVGPVPGRETHLRYRGRPYVATGFKVYVSDHAFIRTDIRTSWSTDGLAALGWRSGVGVDF